MPGAALSLKEENSAMPAIMSAWVCPLRRLCSRATVTFTLKDSASMQQEVSKVIVNKQCPGRKSNEDTLNWSESSLQLSTHLQVNASPLLSPSPPPPAPAPPPPPAWSETASVKLATWYASATQRLLTSGHVFAGHILVMPANIPIRT